MIKTAVIKPASDHSLIATDKTAAATSTYMSGLLNWFRKTTAIPGNFHNIKTIFLDWADLYTALFFIERFTRSDFFLFKYTQKYLITYHK